MTVQIAQDSRSLPASETGTASSTRCPDAHDYVVDEIEGRIPEALTGTLYRNGPAHNEVGGKPYAHLFDGDAMLSQFTIADGARALPQPLRADHALPEGAQRRQAAHARLRPAASGRRAHERVPPARERRQHQRHATTRGNLLALWEGGKPWRLDPDTLDTTASTTSTAS